MLKAIQYFKEAIERDPNYARAYAALSRSYYSLVVFLDAMPVQQGMPLVEEMAKRALEIDNTLAEAHSALEMSDVLTIGTTWGRKGNTR